jgi:hypothetical protein
MGHGATVSGLQILPQFSRLVRFLRRALADRAADALVREGARALQSDAEPRGQADRDERHLRHLQKRIAFITVGALATVPPSPTPLAPSGFVALGMRLTSTVIGGTMAGTMV